MDPEPPKSPSDGLTIADDLRAEVTNAFYFRTEPSAISPRVQSLGEVDVMAWIHAGLCGEADWNPSNEDFFEDAAGRAEGIPRISFGRIRNTTLENVRHSDDDGPDTNFRFDLDPGECYRMLVDRHNPTVAGGYAVEWTGTREVAHGSWSPDAGWGDGFHWHDLPASLSTDGGADFMWTYSEPVALRSNVTIAGDHLRAEVTNVFYFDTEASAVGASVRSFGDTHVQAWIHAGNCGPRIADARDADIFEYARERSDGNHLMSFGHIRNTALDHVRHSDNDGPRTNFWFDLDPGECYTMLVEGYVPETGGSYGVEVTGTRRVGHSSWSRDGGWWRRHWHDASAARDPDPEPRETVVIAGDHLRAEVTNLFYFDTQASAVGASVRSLGDTDVQAWIHAGNCGPRIADARDADVFEYARERSDGNHLMSFGHIRNTALDHVRHSDDDGPGTNFWFDLDPGECYTMLVEGYVPETGGSYGVEVTGTRRVGHSSWSRDGGWRRRHWHDASAVPDPDPEPRETILIGADHLWAEATNVFWFRTEESARNASVRSLGRTNVQAWIHAGNCGKFTIYSTEEDIFEDARNRSDGHHIISFGHIRNTALDHVRYSNDDGPGTNFRFDLEPDECYKLLVDGYTPATSGSYGLEVAGTRGGVGHNALSHDGRRWEWSPHGHGDIPTGIVTGWRAYLVQAVQTMGQSVPLVAGRDALLRVFPIGGRPTDFAIPAVRARFYRHGREVHVEDVPGGFEPIPTEVDESSLAKSFNARIPGHVVQPGLEVIVEIDTVGMRIPETGRLAVNVLDLPPLDLTLIPFLWTRSNDRSVIDQTRAMAARPESHELLADVRRLLPVGRLRVTSLSYVWAESNRASRVLAQVEAIRTARGGTGHYMGLMSDFHRWGGMANRPGWSSVAEPRADVIAHEVGHNLGLRHAPCGDPRNVDPAFPHRGGTIGAWGYDFAEGRPVSPWTHDLMSYCYPRWISPYQFSKALQHRLGGQRFAAEGVTQGATVAERAESLLLWGGTDAQGAPYLEPAFVIDAPLRLPLTEGDYRLTGRTARGAELFSLTFGMPEVADGEGGSVFAFALPVRPEWEEGLASLTLSGPGGSTTIDDGSDLPMTILRDPGSGQIRAFLQGDRRGDSLGQAFAPDPGVALDPSLEVLFSRGIPDGAAWRR